MPSSRYVLSGSVMARRLRVSGGARSARAPEVLHCGPMRAVTIRDKELSVEDHPDPEPGSGEILVRVRAAGINGADMMQRRGLYPAPPGSPDDIPGLELAGEVVACGPGARRFSPGDRVLAGRRGGGRRRARPPPPRPAGGAPRPR